MTAIMFIPASISTKSGNWYSLVLFYEQPFHKYTDISAGPGILRIWLLAFVCILFVSRFLLRRAFEPTERMLQSQKDFVAAASHELKSPLAVIMANVENIQNIETAEPQAQNHLKVIDAECTRMSRLVRDMLLLASSTRFNGQSRYRSEYRYTYLLRCMRLMSRFAGRKRYI